MCGGEAPTRMASPGALGMGRKSGLILLPFKNLEGQTEVPDLKIIEMKQRMILV